MKMRKLLVLLFGALILVATHYSIFSREDLLAHGQLVLLRLAPVDPRSLMQGDYMELRFDIANDLRKVLADEVSTDGNVVVAVSEDGVAEFARIDNGSALAPDERLMQFRLRNRKVMFATNAFFFEEGTAYIYSQARFGEFRVGRDGEAILTHLRTDDLQRLGSGWAG